MDHIPNTQHTEKMRALWDILQELGSETGESFEDYYARHCQGGSPNGRAVAATLFYRALNYWPDYFSPADGPAVAVWGEVMDAYPLITPEVIEDAVDLVSKVGVKEPGMYHFLEVARRLTGEMV